jgi:hypothetical protein
VLLLLLLLLLLATALTHSPGKSGPMPSVIINHCDHGEQIGTSSRSGKRKSGWHKLE